MAFRIRAAAGISGGTAELELASGASWSTGLQRSRGQSTWLLIRHSEVESHLKPSEVNNSGIEPAIGLVS